MIALKRSHVFKALRIAAGSVIATVLLLALFLRLFSDHVANAILSNVVRSQLRENSQTALAISPSPDEVQIVGGRGEGISCSLPYGIEPLIFRRAEDSASINLQSRQACAFHDYCYRHGAATYGYTQADCDFLLQEHAFRICRFSHEEKSVKECETNARKVTLGVRMGGFGSFRRTDDRSTERRSTYFEFDPFPGPSQQYASVRVGNVPNWGKLSRRYAADSLFSRALYLFQYQPAGVRISAFVWPKDGTAEILTMTVPAPFDLSNSPPIVLNDRENDEIWFAWWQRQSPDNSLGRIAAVSTKRGTCEDWWSAKSGSRSSPAQSSGCTPSLNSVDPNVPPAVLERFFTDKIDLEVSELHPVDHPMKKDSLELAGLSTGSCNPNESTNRSPCLIIVRLEPKSGEVKAHKHQANDPNCNNLAKKSCDRYRSFAHQAFVIEQPDGPQLGWLRRGTADGTGYESSVVLRRFSPVGEEGNPAKDLGDVSIQGAEEKDEPLARLQRSDGSIQLLGLRVKDGFVHARLTEQASEESSWRMRTEDDLPRIESSWLQRPAQLWTYRIGQSTTHHFLIFTQIAPTEANQQLRILTLDLKGGVNQSTDGQSFQLVGHDPVAPGILTATDLTGDGVVDIALARRTLPKTRPATYDAVLLVGNLDDNLELRFSRH